MDPIGGPIDALLLTPMVDPLMDPIGGPVDALLLTPLMAPLMAPLMPYC